MIHVALASAYATEAAARTVLTDPSGAHAPYLGIWVMPVPYRTEVHVFTEAPAEDLEAQGWTCLAEGTDPA